MANDINRVTLVGNLVRDCGANERDFGYTQGGLCIASIDIASNSAKKQQDGTWGSEVSYFTIHIFGKTAENLKPYLKKGQKVGIDGRLKQERWQDKNGNNQSKIVILADNIQLLGGKNENSQSSNSENKSSYAQQYEQQNLGDGGVPGNIPF